MKRFFAPLPPPPHRLRPGARRPGLTSRQMLLGLWALPALAAPAQALTLASPDWRVTIDPATLHTTATLPASGRTLELSAAQPARPAGEPVVDARGARWTLADGTRVSAELQGTALSVRFERRAEGRVVWPQVPPDAQGLILPIAEGVHVAADDRLWRQALGGEYQDIDTTTDLSLPALGLEQGQQVISVLFVNPFNNRLRFDTSGSGLGVSATHEFTALDAARPYEVRIFLDGPDRLAPARHYRRWRQDGGTLVSLKDKLAAARDGQRLIGASHVYLWGERLLVPQDVRDWPALQKAIPAQWLDTAERRQAQRDGAIARHRHAQETLLQAIDAAMKARHPGHDAQAFGQRRQALVAAFGPMLGQPSTWGDASSPKMIARLREAGLSRLWLGLPQWTAGFASPEGIAAAREAGYLIAPYDSYDTALPEPNDQPAWLTAQMGQDVFRRCAVVNRDGSRRTGFGGRGVYVNPACVRPVMQRRVPALQAASHYNSWFLDVAATGMAFDDHDPAKRTSQAQDIDNRMAAAAWIGERLGVVVGSEDGFAVANRTVAFAHGAQTRGFAWGDRALHKDAGSPYFLGRWWPDHEPQFFFKPVKLKPEHAAMYFDPARRLPLLQAAMHDSLVTTHHWSLDSLKFPQVQAARDLLAQLYNVPPLVNLSLDTAGPRLAYLQRADAFFRPLHQRLYTQALTDFRWLDRLGRVQQTRFADGTRIVANFGDAVFREGELSVPPLSALAVLPSGEQLRYQAGPAPVPARG